MQHTTFLASGVDSSKEKVPRFVECTGNYELQGRTLTTFYGTRILDDRQHPVAKPKFSTCDATVMPDFQP